MHTRLFGTSILALTVAAVLSAACTRSSENPGATGTTGTGVGVHVCQIGRVSVIRSANIWISQCPGPFEFGTTAGFGKEIGATLAVGPNSVLDPFLWLQAMEDRSRVTGHAEGAAQNVVSSTGESSSLW